MFFSWENFAEFEGTSITQEITEELPDDVHSGALYAVLGLSLVVLFGDVAFGYKCRETKMKRAANFSELSERLSELDAKLAQEEVAAATPVSLARSLSEQRLEHAKGKAMAELLRDADQQAAATVPPRTREPEPQSPEEMAAEWHDFKRTKLRFLVLTCVLGFASELLLWMLAPFLPLVAKNKGVSPELVGVLFACHPIALGISSHLAPWLMRNIEPFVLLQRTLFLQAIFISGFGLAGGIESTVPFICCAAINRFMLGLMSGINEPTSQAITLRVVPTHAIGFAFGMIISSRFTAMLIGPALGGALYTAGGFPLPFMVSGCIYLFLGCLTMYVGISTPGDVSPPPGDVTVWTLVRVRGMPWMLGCIFLLWLNTMALEPLYQPQLARAPYKLSVLNVGLVLSSATGALVLTMSLSGHLSRMLDAYSQQTVGFVLLITALPFLGPEPGFHLDANVSLFVGALVACFVAVGLIGPTQSVLCLRVLSDAGFAQQDVASALSSANVTFAMLGSLCGPLLSGALVPDVLAFESFTKWQAVVTGALYALPLCYLQRYRQNAKATPCAGCLSGCSALWCQGCQGAGTEPEDQAERGGEHSKGDSISGAVRSSASASGTPLVQQSSAKKGR